ncbi:unnamed protein product, partial [Laminaria digitata]
MTLIGDVSFIGNTAVAGGGSLSITAPATLEVQGTLFKGNHAQFGGAVAMTSTEGIKTKFDTCTFESNTVIADGGAMYLSTSAGREIIIRSIFRNNLAGT